MGVVISQSIKNTITTYFGFLIGAINTLFLYTQFLSDDYYGLIGFLLSTANIMSPILMFGVANTLIKFYSSYTSNEEKDNFLTLMLVLPLVVIIPTGLIGGFAYEFIANWLSEKNTIVKHYTWTIYVIAIAMAYFEIFFSWSKVHLKSVFGNLMKEVFHRVCTTLLLIAVYFKYLTVQQFIYAMVLVYVIRTLVLKLYAFRLYFPKFRLKKPLNFNQILKYNILIIVAGSVAILLFDLDKLMLGKLIKIDNVAYYNVAVFIAMVISVPARAMHQITNPLTAEYINNKEFGGLKDLYQKSSLNLLVIGGLVFVLIITNINQMYEILPQEYSKGLYVVILTALVKLFTSALGNNNAILFNSEYYRIVLLLGVLIIIVAVVLNLVLIPNYGINGAAIASFIAFILYDGLKLWYVNKKMKLQPFTKYTIYVVVLIISFTVLFYFIEFPFNAWVNIVVKSVLICFLYGFIILKGKFSETISEIVNKFLIK